MTNWQRYKISDLLSSEVLFIGDGYRAKNEELSSHGIPFARGGNINNGFQFDDADRFPEEDLPKVGNKISQIGDVVFTSKGTVGRFAFVKEETPRFVYSPQLCFWRVLRKQTIEPKFLYYWMFGREFFLQYNGVKGQTDMADYVSLSDQRRMHITLPSISDQRAIAHILGTLDDKIELNRHMNETLEAMARALFKSWFVDFDPVRAKMEGRQPAGMDAETAALFSDAFEHSRLGDVPRGWNVGSILEFANLLSGGTPNTSIAEYWDGDLEWVSAKDVSNAKGLFLLNTEKRITTAGLEHSNTRLLPEKTTVVTARGTVGAHCMLGREMTMNQTNYGLKAKHDFGDYFVFFSLSNLVEQLKQHSYGTIFDTITTQTFRDALSLRPDQKVARLFEQHVSPYMERILLNLQESQTLAAMRDALLPKLLSGEVRVGLGPR